MDHGTLILNAVVDACKSWGLSDHLTQTEFLLKISGAPGQVFDIEIEDDRDEAILFIDVAHFHTHFERYVPPETAVKVVRNLLTGESSVQARYRGRHWIESQITGELGAHVGSVSLNPFRRFLPERIETLENKVVIPE